MAVYALQKLTILVHVERQVIISNGLHLLLRRQTILNVHREITPHFSFINLLLIGWIRSRVILHVHKVVLLVKVFINPALHLDSTKKVLDALALLLDIKAV